MLVYHSTQINEISNALKKNKAAIVLTDTIFGIICKKKELIYQIKHRNHEKKIVKFINNIDDLNMPKSYNDEMTNYYFNLLKMLVLYIVQVLIYQTNHQLQILTKQKLFLKNTIVIFFLLIMENSQKIPFHQRLLI